MFRKKLFHNPMFDIGKPMYFVGDADGDGGSGDDDNSGKGAGSGNPDDGIIADIDFSDIDPSIVEAVKTKVAGKVKLFQKDYTKKTQETAALKKQISAKEAKLSRWNEIIEKVEGDPVLAEKLSGVISDYSSGKSLSRKTIDNNVKSLDKQIEEAEDADTREQLRRIRDIIRQESGTETLIGEIETLKAELAAVKSFSATSIKDRVNSDIAELSGRFGKDIIEKYEDGIRSLANNPKHIGITVEKIFLNLADNNDIRQAYINESKVKTKSDIDRKKKGIIPNDDGVSPSGIKIDVDKHGRYDKRTLIRQILDKNNLRV